MSTLAIVATALAVGLVAGWFGRAWYEAWVVRRNVRKVMEFVQHWSAEADAYMDARTAHEIEQLERMMGGEE